MKKLSFLVAALCATMFASAAELMVCDFTQASAKSSAYSGSWAYGDWTVTNGANNNGGWTYVKLGGKSATLATANPCSVSTSIACESAVDSVVVTSAAGSLAKSGMSVNSWALEVYSDSLSTKIDEVAGTTFAAAAATYVFKPSEGAQWPAGSYYKITFDLANTSTSNGIVCLEKIALCGASATPVIEADDVAFGAVISGSASSKEMVVSAENLSESIVATLKDGTHFEVSGTLTAEGGTLSILVTETVESEYVDTLVLTSGAIVAKVVVTASVVVLEGEGTEENPFTCADVIKLNNSLGTAEEYWVMGYIIGGVKSQDNALVTDNNVASAIGLADAKGVENPDIAVQLEGSSSARTALNVVDNSGMIGKKVKVKGTLEAYCNNPGVKGVGAAADYVIIDEPVTAIESVEVSNIYGVNGTIYGAEGARIYTITGMDVTEQNGALNGAYIVRMGDKAVKVIVK